MSTSVVFILTAIVAILFFAAGYALGFARGFVRATQRAVAMIEQYRQACGWAK